MDKSQMSAKANDMLRQASDLFNESDKGELEYYAAKFAYYSAAVTSDIMEGDVSYANTHLWYAEQSLSELKHELKKRQ